MIMQTIIRPLWSYLYIIITNKSSKLVQCSLFTKCKILKEIKTTEKSKPVKAADYGKTSIGKSTKSSILLPNCSWFT